MVRRRHNLFRATGTRRASLASLSTNQVVTDEGSEGSTSVCRDDYVGGQSDDDMGGLTDIRTTTATDVDHNNDDQDDA